MEDAHALVLEEVDFDMRLKDEAKDPDLDPICKGAEGMTNRTASKVKVRESKRIHDLSRKVGCGVAVWLYKLGDRERKNRSKDDKNYDDWFTNS
jgi:hypothetical protein